ncbi:PEP/pyruvate-binding domain-containing protein [Myxococcota bacterium]|nr:PEP/pyruvate-binding domain-containing protein [Myxococcota bacterium]
MMRTEPSSPRRSSAEGPSDLRDAPFARIVGALFALALAACGSDPVAPSDAGTGDAGVDAGGDAGDAGDARDAGGDAGRDAGPFEWPVETGPIAITPHESWKNTVAFDDPFLSAPVFGEGRDVRWIKFAVLMRDPSKVYFQNSQTYPFHVEFATERLDPFVGLSREAFDQISLHEADQEVILGAVLFAPTVGLMEYGVQLVRQDPYHPEMVRIVFDLVRDAITTPSEGYYFPTFEQAASAAEHSAWLAAHGVRVSSVARWATDDACYARGWALGRLVEVPGAELETAYASGALGPGDILLTDAVPAEIPFVSGVLSRTPSTPSSHVALLAQAWQVPFAYVVSEEELTRITALVGRDVVLRVDQGCDVRVLDVDGQLSDAERTGLLALKAPPEVDVAVMAPYGALSADVDTLGPADVRYFGGKAAHFGLLRDAIPEASPEAIALSFDLWNGYLDQTLARGKTLRAEIDERLARHTWPADIATVKADLAAIRAMIEDEAVFDAPTSSALLAALSGFEPLRKIRFRSSSNAEDGVNFTGAGLYESHSGCLADDQDADTAGPSACDAAQPKERGVLRAIKKVFASFYGDNAFLERLRYRIDEHDVGMAVLVHYSFPDPLELANGVATLRKSGDFVQLELVTQAGAVSVTNPEGGAEPEVVRVDVYSFGTYPTLVRPSTLVPLGGYVLEWEAEYVELAELLVRVADRYSALNPGLAEFLLDFEYKKEAPGNLSVKQVRPLPIPSWEPTVPTFLVDEGATLCTFQGEAGDVFSNHRMKVRWGLETDSLWLDDAGLASTFFRASSLEWVSASGVATVEGDLSTWPGFVHTRDPSGAPVDTFSITGDAFARTWSLTTELPRLVAPLASPILGLSDAVVFATAEYSTPVPTLDWNGMPTTTSTDFVRLTTWCPTLDAVGPKNPRFEETITGPRGVRVDVALFWPIPPGGIAAGYTAPLFAWESSTITGLTTEPIVLRGHFSQTYRPEHHNFASNYVFEPRLEPGISAATLAELDALDIVWLYATSNGTGAIWAAGRDGTLRRLE